MYLIVGHWLVNKKNIDEQHIAIFRQNSCIEGHFAFYNKIFFKRLAHIQMTEDTLYFIGYSEPYNFCTLKYNRNKNISYCFKSLIEALKHIKNTNFLSKKYTGPSKKEYKDYIDDIKDQYYIYLIRI